MMDVSLTTDKTLDAIVQDVDGRAPFYIGIAGKKRHGKNSIATMLNMLLTDVNDNQSAVMICAFADQLKTVAKELFYWSGLKDDFGRWLLQRLGTEVVMGRYGPDFWVRALDAKIQDRLSHFVAMPQIIAITDVRFPLEFDYIKEKGGEVWRVNRPGMPPSDDQHITEIGLDNETQWDVVLGAETLDELFAQVKKQAERLVEKGLI